MAIANRAHSGPQIAWRPAVALLLAAPALAGCRALPPQPDAGTREGLWQVQRALDRSEHLVALDILDSLAASSYPVVHYLRGRVLSDLFRFDEAASAYEAALESDPRYRNVSYQLGNNAFYVGQNRMALRHYGQEARHLRRLRTRQDSAAKGAVLRQMGRVYARLGVSDSAEVAYRQSLAFAGASAETWAWLAQLKEIDGEFEQALEHAQRALESAPSNAEYHLLVGTLLLRTGAIEAAERYLMRAAAELPWSASAHYNLGRCLLQLGRSEEAAPFLAATDSLQELASNIVLARFAVRRNPDLVGDWLVLASLYRQSGQTKEAAEAFAIARQLNN